MDTRAYPTSMAGIVSELVAGVKFRDVDSEMAFASDHGWKRFRSQGSLKAVAYVVHHISDVVWRR